MLAYYALLFKPKKVLTVSIGTENKKLKTLTIRPEWLCVDDSNTLAYNAFLLKPITFFCCLKKKWTLIVAIELWQIQAYPKTMNIK